MIEYQLGAPNTFTQKLVDGVATGEWVDTITNQAFLRWLEEGNEPLPADEPTAAEQPAED